MKRSNKINRNHKALRIDNVSGCFNRFGEKKSPYDLNESVGFNNH